MRVTSSIRSSVGFPGSPSPDFVVGTAGSRLGVSPPERPDPRVFRVFPDRGSAPRSRPRANAKGTASWALLRGLPYRLADVSKDVLPADEPPEARRRDVAARRTVDGAHAVEILDRVAVDRRLPLTAARGPACRCGLVRVRHRRNARHADRAPSKPHAFAGLPGISVPTHEPILTQGDPTFDLRRYSDFRSDETASGSIRSEMRRGLRGATGTFHRLIPAERNVLLRHPLTLAAR